MSKWLWIAIGAFVVLAGAGGGYIVSKLDQVVESMAQAIQQAEGWYEGSFSFRTNNPGNITDMGRPGQIGTVTNPNSGITFPVFDTYENGFAALVWKLKRAFTGASSTYLPTMSIYEFFDKYSGDRNEAETVAGLLGIDPNTTLGDLIL
jgi:hypothetical protein